MFNYAGDFQTMQLLQQYTVQRKRASVQKHVLQQHKVAVSHAHAHTCLYTRLSTCPGGYLCMCLHTSLWKRLCTGCCGRYRGRAEINSSSHFSLENEAWTHRVRLGTRPRLKSRGLGPRQARHHFDKGYLCEPRLKDI